MNDITGVLCMQKYNKMWCFITYSQKLKIFLSLADCFPLITIRLQIKFRHDRM